MIALLRTEIMNNKNYAIKKIKIPSKVTADCNTGFGNTGITGISRNFSKTVVPVLPLKKAGITGFKQKKKKLNFFERKKKTLEK